MEQKAQGGDSQAFKDAEKSKVSKLLDELESILLGVVLLVGNYFRTIWYILLHPKLIQELDKNKIKTEKTLRPLTFLISSLLFFLFIYSKSFLQLNLYFSLDDSLIDIFQKIEEYITGFDYNLKDTLIFVAPFILSLALLSKLTSITGRIFNKKSSFKKQFNLYCYIVGTALFILGFFINVSLLTAIPVLRNQVNFLQSIFIITLFFLTCVSFILLIFRFVEQIRISFSTSWIISIIIISILFIVIFGLYLLLINLLQIHN